jgi:hypothetical protein
MEEGAPTRSSSISEERGEGVKEVKARRKKGETLLEKCVSSWIM